MDNLKNLSDKELKKELKLAENALNAFANKVEVFRPDGTLNQEGLGTQAYFEISNKFRDVNNEIEKRAAPPTTPPGQQDGNQAQIPEPAAAGRSAQPAAGANAAGVDSGGDLSR